MFFRIDVYGYLNQHPNVTRNHERVIHVCMHLHVCFSLLLSVWILGYIHHYVSKHLYFLKARTYVSTFFSPSQLNCMCIKEVDLLYTLLYHIITIVCYFCSFVKIPTKMSLCICRAVTWQHYKNKNKNSSTTLNGSKYFCKVQCAIWVKTYTKLCYVLPSY